MKGWSSPTRDHHESDPSTTTYSQSLKKVTFLPSTEDYAMATFLKARAAWSFKKSKVV